MRYAKVTNNIPTETSFKQIKNENPNVSFPKEPSEALMAEYDVYPIQDAPPTLAVNEEITSTDLSFDGSTVTKNYTVVEVMPLDEWNAAEQKKQDNIDLRLRMQSNYVFVELVRKLLDNGTIQASDFTAEVRQEFLEMETLVNRLR